MKHSSDIYQVISSLAQRLQQQQFFLATAESCTGGLIAATLTDVAGSSAWFKGAVVSYANEVKAHVLGVLEKDLQTVGAVSEPVVLRMAQGVAQVIGTQCSLAVSGVAGPGGGSPEKPVGTVWIAWHTPQKTWANRFVFSGDRHAVRLATVYNSLLLLDQALAGDYA